MVHSPRPEMYGKRPTIAVLMKFYCLVNSCSCLADVQQLPMQGSFQRLQRMQLYSKQQQPLRLGSTDMSAVSNGLRASSLWLSQQPSKSQGKC